MRTLQSPFATYDPRTAPVVQTDTDLAAVPPDRLTPEALRERFAAPPAWEPEVRQEPVYMTRDPTSAGVLVPLVERTEGVMVLLTERSRTLSTHSGQVAFPGGQADAHDADIAATALREAREEVGLDRRFVSVIGELPVYETGSQFRVTPVVGLVREGFALRANTAEVADVFEVPLAFLMNPAHHRHHETWMGGRVRHWISMPYAAPSDLDAGPERAPHERFIWGATAGMLRNLYRFLIA